MPARGDSSIETLSEQIRQARAEQRSLEIRGQGSKGFLGMNGGGERLSSLVLDKVVTYQPSELVITVQAGLPLNTLEALLAEKRQRLAFEPLMLSTRDGERQGTVGGMVASALAGPRRPWAGGVRDAVLGLQLINGEGKLLNFGGQVMKNVAGYDVSRLMCGAMGCLGMLTQVSLKVLPVQEALASVSFSEGRDRFLMRLLGWQNRMSPISGVAHDGQHGWLRLEGSAANIKAFMREEGFSAEVLPLLPEMGEPPPALQIWQQLRHLQGPFFDNPRPLWRLSLPSGTRLDADVFEQGQALMDWGGAQFWVKSEDEQRLEALAQQCGGHLYAYTQARSRHFPALAPAIMQLHQNLKQAYDPGRIFNPGRMYAEF